MKNTKQIEGSSIPVRKYATTASTISIMNIKARTYANMLLRKLSITHVAKRSQKNG